jgi:hypothetical protein
VEGEDPVSLAMGATAASGILGAGASVVGGIQAQQAGNVAAEQAAQESKAALEQSGSQIAASETTAARRIGSAVAGAGASGVTAASAAPVLDADYAQAKIQSAYERFSGKLASTEDLYQGQLAKYQGNQALIGGIIGAGSSILGAASGLGQIGISGGRNLNKGWGNLFGGGTSPNP